MAGVRLGGLWIKKLPNEDKDFLEGKLGLATIRIYQNSYQKSDKDPAYVMYLSQTPLPGDKPVVKPRSRITPRPQGNVAPQKAPYKDHTVPNEGPPTEEVPWPDDSEMPF